MYIRKHNRVSSHDKNLLGLVVSECAPFGLFKSFLAVSVLIIWTMSYHLVDILDVSAITTQHLNKGIINTIEYIEYIFCFYSNYLLSSLRKLLFWVCLSSSKKVFLHISISLNKILFSFHALGFIKIVFAIFSQCPISKIHWDSSVK